MPSSSVLTKKPPRKNTRRKKRPHNPLVPRQSIKSPLDECILSLDPGWTSLGYTVGRVDQREIIEMGRINLGDGTSESETIQQTLTTFINNMKSLPAAVLIEEQLLINPPAMYIELLLRREFSKRSIHIEPFNASFVRKWFNLKKGKKEKKKSAITVAGHILAVQQDVTWEGEMMKTCINEFLYTKKADDMADSLLQYVLFTTP